MKELAFAALARHDDRSLVRRTLSFDVEPQVGLSRFGVGPVAREAVLRENRQDVAAKVDRLWASAASARQRQEAEKSGTA